MDMLRKKLGGEPKAHRVTRDGARDLSFRGWLIGQGDHGSGGNSGYACDWNRGVHVYIYLTTGGNLITMVDRWSCWQGEDGSGDAAIHRTPEAALAWLVDDAGGILGVASKEAWEAACQAYPPLAGMETEAVE